MTGSSNDIIGKYHEYIASAQDNNKSESEPNDSDLDDQDFLDLLEEDDAATQRYREQRTQQLAQQMAAARANAARATVETLESESALFALTTSYTGNSNNNNNKLAAAAQGQHAYVVVHFFRPDFTTCTRMDTALSQLARAHFGEATFVRLDVAKAPFLAVKLDLRVLPCVLVLSAATGREVKRLHGFDELGNNPNDAETVFRRFEQILVQLRVISRVTYGGGEGKVGLGSTNNSNNKSGIRTSRNRHDDESDDDWD
ncbi:hypothetical protein D0Z03_002200 [Geotrichum reessii]|nr:hypothetical protein D0Z03_002200 [Galactomyces reessii]